MKKIWAFALAVVLVMLGACGAVEVVPEFETEATTTTTTEATIEATITTEAETTTEATTTATSITTRTTTQTSTTTTPAPTLDPDMALTIRQHWFRSRPRQGAFLPERVIIDHYFGTYNGSVALMIRSDDEGFTMATRQYEIAGVEFHFNDGQALWVWNDGEFHRLHEAYMHGLLTTQDIRSIQHRHQQAFPFMY